MYHNFLALIINYIFIFYFFIQVVQRNSRLMYENASLKIHMQQLIQNIEKLKSDYEKTRSTNNEKNMIDKLCICENKNRHKIPIKTQSTP